MNASGVATFATAALASGSHSITAVYLGDQDHLGSTSTPKTVAVATTATTTKVTSSLTPAGFGQSVTFTAHVTAGSIGVSALAGETVTCMDGATILGTGFLNASGIATFATSSLSIGTHSITAVYGGDAFFGTSTGGVSQAVKMATTTTLTSSGSPSKAGNPVTFTAQMAVSGGSISALVGQVVTFKNGSTVLGTAKINSSGVAVFTISSLPAGSDNITAVFAASANAFGSTSAVLVQTVQKIGRIT